MSFRSAALFADDIREEANKQFTIVGILPDTVQVEQASSDQIARLAKLAVYVRTSIGADDDLDVPIRVQLVSPEGSEIFTTDVTPRDLPDLTADSASGSPYLTMVTRVVMPAFPILEHGRFEVRATRGDESILAGFINVIPVETKSEGASKPGSERIADTTSS